MFMGTFYNSIDSKNRMIVPAKFRNELGDRCVVTKGFDNCLNLYTVEEWKNEVKRMMTVPRNTAGYRAVLRKRTGDAAECEIDRQGRILIPAALIAEAGFKKELVTIGVVDSIEIWSKEVWESPDNEAKLTDEEFTKAAEKFVF